ncbi:MAG: hypothetical protein WCI05_16650, partial [Myxococcales bacterium]
QERDPHVDVHIAHKESIHWDLTGGRPGTAGFETTLSHPAVPSSHTRGSWQFSPDNGKTWVDAISTPYAKTTIPNLTLLTLYGFRVKVTIGTTTGASTHPVMLLVH